MSSPPSDTTGTTVCDSTATGTATFESKSTVKVSTQSDKSEVTANDDGIKQEIKSSPLEREQHSHKSTTESSACESFEENSEMETDQLLKQEVEEFIEKLMESVINDINVEDLGIHLPLELETVLDVPLACGAEGELTQSTVESCVTEFHSCISHTDTSLFFSLTSFPSLDEHNHNEGSDKAFLTPNQSYDGRSVTATMSELTALPEKASLPENEEMREADSDSANSSCVLSDAQLKQNKKTRMSDHHTSLHHNSQSNVVLGQRSELCVFEVKLVQGLLGLGLTLGSDELKEIVIQKIRMLSPAATQGELRVGDRIMEINGHSVIGKSPSQAQRLLSQVKWREEVRILAMPPQETVVFHFSETTNAGVIVMKLNTTSDKPLGVDVEGGSDTECPYIRISAIKPGSVAEWCGMLKVGDELVEIDQHLMVGTTHSEAIDILRHISKPITLTVQRRQSLNLMDRIHSHHSET